MRPTHNPRVRPALRPRRRPPVSPLPDPQHIFLEPRYTDPRVLDWYAQAQEEDQQRPTRRR
ncbi:hypothetical protein ACH4PU_31080 [Streptomyces sp. NPDC021100]|uniref:hypothetical protein n=1 Tax=Streptomyces sp. NPDC021100 TaxID=3365114 RepID=UPI0037B411BD